MWQFQPLAVPLFVGAFFFWLFALITWKRSTALAARLFIIFSLAVALFMATYGLELLSADLNMMLFWIRFELTAFTLVPPLWLMFVLAYSGHEYWLTRRRVAALLAGSSPLMLLVWTLPHHDLLFSAIDTYVVDGFAFLKVEFGLAYWLVLFYLYALVVAGFVIVLVTAWRGSALYRQQVLPLLPMILLPLGIDIFTVFFAAYNPIPHIYLLPFGLALACIPLAWAVFEHRLFRLLPDAHHLILDTMDEAVLVLDAKRRIIEANLMMQKIAGVKVSEMRGRRLAEIIPAAAPYVERYKNQDNVRDEILYHDGNLQRAFDFQLSPLRDAQGKIGGYVFVLRDVTRRRNIEVLLRRYTEELEARNRELDSFSHTVAHDLRAPLSVIKGYAELMLEMSRDAMPEAQRTYVERIHQSSVSMNLMISNLLLLADLTNPTETLTEVNARAIVHAALLRFQPRIEERGIRIEIAHNMPPVMTQAGWLEEVFANLISNAIKYIGVDNPDPLISVSGYREDQMVRYQVTDNGVGIAPEQQARLFDMFTRFHRGEAEGMGIGLSIVLRIVTRLGGDVGVISQPGAGSTFWFTLPDVIAGLRTLNGKTARAAAVAPSQTDSRPTRLDSRPASV